MDLSVISMFGSILLMAYSSLWLIYAISSLIDRKKRVYSSSDNRENELVSVLLPCKDEEKVIKNIIYDCINQTHKNIEIIAIAHNCTDKTYEKILEIKDKRVKVIKLETNKSGKGLALNSALNVVEGNYIAQFDTDNRIHPEFVERALKYMDICDCIQGKIDTKNKNYNLLTKLQDMEYMIFGDIFEKGRLNLSLNAGIGGTSVFIKRNALNSVNGWDNELTEDFDLFMKLNKKGYKIIYVDECIVYDEKPIYWDVLFKQRTRWIKGHMDVMKKRFRENITKPFDMLYLTAPLGTIGWYILSTLFVIYIFLVATGTYLVTYWSAPLFVWIYSSLIIYLITLRVFIRHMGIKALLYFIPFIIFSHQWIVLLPFSFRVKSWGETKTEHGCEEELS